MKAFGLPQFIILSNLILTSTNYTPLLPALVRGGSRIVALTHQHLP